MKIVLEGNSAPKCFFVPSTVVRSANTVATPFAS